MSRAKSNASLSSLLQTSVGAIVTSDADSLEVLEVGADGYILTADSGEPNGVKWAAAGTSGLSAGQITDLTDSGDSTLHYHATDRALSSATGTLAVANGGTGQTTAQAAINALSAVSAASAGQVLTKSGSNAVWVSPAGAGLGDISTTGSAVTDNLVAYNDTTGDVVKDSGIPLANVVDKATAQTLTNKTMSTGSTWAGTKIGSTVGGTDQTSWTKGDVLYSGATNSLSKLPIGVVGQVLQVSSGGIPAWASTTSEVGGYDSTTNYNYLVIGYRNSAAYMGYNGVTAAPDGQGQWLRFIPTVAEAPIEMNIYNSGSQGIASSNGAGTLTRMDIGNSTAFTSAWVGKRIQYGSGVYTVVSVASTESMVVTPSPASNAYETFHVAYHRAFGLCSTAWDGSQTIITRTSGDPFFPTFDASFKCWINGTQRTVTFISTQVYTCTTNLGTLTDVSFDAQITINDQLTTLRVQKLTGSNEENLSLFARYDGYHIRSYYAGYGKEKPIYIGHTDTAIKFNTDGTIAATGSASHIPLKLAGKGLSGITMGDKVNTVNVYDAVSGYAPVVAARGASGSNDMGFDLQGYGTFNFTAGTFAKPVFQVYGVNAADYPTVSSGAGVVYVGAAGGSTSVDIAITPKGSGYVRMGTKTATSDAAITGYITIKDAAGNLVKLATVA
jgi:hypothetical protein